MKRTLLRLFAMSVALALQFGAAAQLPSFYATVPSGQSLRFEVTSPTTCQLAGNNTIGGSATDSLIIPYTVSDGTTTYQVTAIGQYGINGFRGCGTLMLPNSITRIGWIGITSNNFDTIIFPAGLNFMDDGAVVRSDRSGSSSVLVFRSATPPATTSGYLVAFTNGYTADAVQHIYVPAGQTAAYQSAFGTSFPNATLHEWGTSTPTVVDRHDTIHPGEVRWINNRPYDGTWTIRDSSRYYTENLITRVHLHAVEWHFYADAPTGQRLYYRITGTDSVEVRAPNGSGWAYYTPPTDSLAVPATVTHDGHTYSVFRIHGRAFYLCNAITALTLPEGISEVGPEAIFIMTTRELRVSLPRSLRIIDDYAFNTNSFSSRLKLASDTIWAEVIGRQAFFPKVISQPIVLPNVRTIGYKAFYRIESCPYLWVGDSCTSIGEQAFAETTTAPIVPIPGRISLGTSLQTVGASAFSRPNGRPIHSVEFRGTTVPSFADDVFKNTQVDSIITPCGTSAAYRTALYFSSPGRWDPSNTVFQERGCPVNVYLYDTLFYAMGPVTFAGRSITSPGEYRDTIHLPGYDSINILFVSEVYYSFYADAPTGQRLYYRIIGTDSVEVVAPNGSDWNGYSKPAGSLTIPAAVTHGGTSYSVVRVGDYAFHICTDITSLTLSEGIAEVEAYAFEYCEAITYVSLPRSLRTIGDVAFSGMTRFMNPRNLTLASDTIWAETIAVSAFGENIISQPIVLPNVRTIDFAAFANIYRCPYIFVGDSCTSIGANAFDNAFNQLPGRISLGTSLQTVGNYALGQYNSPLHSVEFRGATVPSFGEGIFVRTQVDSIITPCGTSAAYRTALDAAPVNNQWDASATLFAERGCQVLIDLYDAICAGGTYTFGGQTAVYPSAASVELYDTVRYALYDSITVMHLTVKQNTTGDTAAVACDQFSWYGTDYTASGTPTHVLTNAAGCDSTVTLALTVNYSTTGDTAAVACDQFSWYGTDYTASATPTHLFSNAAGCDSTVTLALTINYSNTGDTAAVACDQFSWYGTDYIASGTPTHVLTNAAGCDSTVTLALTVNYSTTGDTAAVACDQFSWYGTDYIASGTPTHVLTNAAGCDSTVTLALTVNYSTTGDTAAVACDQFSWYGTDYTASGTPTHVLTNAAGCDSTVTLALTVNYSTTGDTAAVACDQFSWYGTAYTASATPTHVLTNAAGCDSTVTLTLTINYSNTGDTAAVACDQFSWYGTAYTASGTPTQVLTNAAGCDSTVTLALTINYSTTGDTSAVACDQFSWYGTDYTASGTPTHLFTNAAGCDSTVTLALTVNYSTTGDTSAVACDQFSWYGTDYTASATPTHLFTNAAGCDSTVTLALTINYSNTGDTSAVACDQFSWYGTDYIASGTPTHVLTNAAGCDSTVTLALTINYSTTGDTAAVACDQFSWYGTAYTASGTPTHVLTNAAGCDSTVTLALTINYSTTGDTSAVAFDRFAWYGTTYTASGTPTHVLTNAAGCDSTVTLALTILEGYATDPTFGEQGIEVEAYGYCAGPGAVRYRLSSGQPDEYSLIFGHAAWTNLGWQRIATPGNIDITVPDGLPTGDYTATLYFRHSAYPDMVSAPIEVTIHVNLPETYVMPLFSDVIALVDTCHCLTDVQWYHREAGATDWEAIPGANDYYYHQEGGLTGEYFVSARYNGQPTYTCPQSDMTTLITEPQPTLTAYPNPTRDVVTLEVGGQWSVVSGQQHVLRVLTLQGVELERRVFEGSTLQLDLSAYQRGSYVVSVDGMVVRVIRN